MREKGLQVTSSPGLHEQISYPHYRCRRGERYDVVCRPERLLGGVIAALGMAVDQQSPPIDVNDPVIADAGPGVKQPLVTRVEVEFFGANASAPNYQRIRTGYW